MMAFNMMVVTNSPIDWPTISSQYSQADASFEVFPIANSSCGNGLGISIPTEYFSRDAWISLREFLMWLRSNYPIEVYEMYSGEAIDIDSYAPSGLA